MRQKVISTIWYYLMIYMNFPNGSISAEDALEDHLGRGSIDLEAIINRLNLYLSDELGIQGRFEILPHMTLSQLLNQINNLQNGKTKI